MNHPQHVKEMARRQAYWAYVSGRIQQMVSEETDLIIAEMVKANATFGHSWRKEFDAARIKVHTELVKTKAAIARGQT